MAAAYLQKNSTKEALEAFKSNLTNLVDLVKSLDYDTKFPDANKRIYRLEKSTSQTNLNSGNGNEAVNTAIYWMLQDPIDEDKCFPNKTNILAEALTNRQIDVYNRAAINLL